MGGTKKFSWLSGGGGADSPLNRKALPRPKFPPLPPSNLSISSSLPPPSFPSLGSASGKQEGADTPLSGLGRLTAVPATHDASRNSMSDDPSNEMVTIRDAIHVMEQERGIGAGVGSGTRPLVKAYLNRT